MGTEGSDRSIWGCLGTGMMRRVQGNLRRHPERLGGWSLSDQLGLGDGGPLPGWGDDKGWN